MNADATDTDQEEGAEGEGAGKPSVWRNWKILVPVVVLLLALIGGALWFFLLRTPAEEGEAAAEDAPAAEETVEREPPPKDAPPIYQALEPALTVNFSQPVSGGRYLQVLIEVMARDPQVIEVLLQNMPAARNDLILLLSEQDPEALRTAAGKKALQKQVLRTLQIVVRREAPALARGLEDVFFTKFVIQ